MVTTEEQLVPIIKVDKERPFSIHIDAMQCPCGGKIKDNLWLAVDDSLAITCKRCGRRWVGKFDATS